MKIVIDRDQVIKEKKEIFERLLSKLTDDQLYWLRFMIEKDSSTGYYDAQIHLIDPETGKIDLPYRPSFDDQDF